MFYRLLRHNGYCNMGHRFQNFCILCGDFVALMSGGEKKDPDDRSSVTFQMENCLRFRLATKEEPSWRCHNCKRLFHFAHIMDWYK